MDKSRRSDSSKDRFRINNRIRAREVRLIGEDGSQVGIVSFREALELADKKNLDLVEVAPNASPPVCRLMDYGKFRYEQSKKEREARKHQKQMELKEVRLRPKTDTHDLEVKANQARRFLHAGDKVKFTVRFRGREMAHTNIGREMLEQLVESLRDVAVVEQKPMLEGRAISLVLGPLAKGKSSASSSAKKTPTKQSQSTQKSSGQSQSKTSETPASPEQDTRQDDLDVSDAEYDDEHDLDDNDVDVDNDFDDDDFEDDDDDDDVEDDDDDFEDHKRDNE